MLFEEALAFLLNLLKDVLAASLSKGPFWRQGADTDAKNFV
jgi:hypothetical protein